MKYIVGIDEVGRGPLAGPVTVGVVVCEAEFYKKLKQNRNLPPLGKDSKKLSPQAREKYAKVLKSLSGVKHIGISYVVVHVSNKTIDSKGLSFCIKKAIAAGFKNLNIKNYLKIKNSKLKILLDGGLGVPVEFTNQYSIKQIEQSTINRGDEKEKIIAWASILAKVSRDALMIRTGKKYPQYGFEIHKGYGTTRHRAAIKKYGLSAIHRKTFCTRIKI
jgi:ribonuclease HII